MQNETFFFARLLFTVLFFATLVAGVFLFKNHRKLFGVDAAMPSENGSSRSYTKVMVYAVWAHALVLSGAFALLLD